MSDWSTYRRLLGYIADQKLWAVLVVLCFFLSAGGEAAFAYVLAEIIDFFNPDAERELEFAAWAAPAAILALAVIRAIGTVGGEYVLSRISFLAVHRIRCELFDSLLVLPSSYFDASTQGHLVSRLTFTTAQLRDTATDALKIIIQDGLKVIVYFAAMIYFNALLTAIFVVVVPFVALIVRYASRRFRAISTRIQGSMGDVTHVASEATAGYRDIRVFGGESFERQRFLSASENNRRQNLKLVTTKAASAQVIQVLVAVVIAGLIGLLLGSHIATPPSTGDIVAYITLAGMLANPIKKLSDVNARLQRGLAAAVEVFDQLDQPAEQDSGQRTLDSFDESIRFDDVSFRYGAETDIVLDGISLEIRRGQTVAFVGASGSGKSTLTSLLARFYEPTAGQILVDGVSIDQISRASLRRSISLVSQDVTLFNDTLRNNVAYGALADASDEAVRVALERAYAVDFVEQMPDGLDTVVGDNGVLLSGGQRQRVAIARAFLKNSPILILDEATAALDTTSEREIQNALADVMQNRTTIVVAHRLSTIESVDVIYVLDAGRIVESGNHQELIARNGAYATLYEAGTSDPPVEETEEPAVEPVVVAHARSAALVESWYGERWWSSLLTPLGWLYARVARRRRQAYLDGRRRSTRLPVPVIVVGNVTVGGSGKSPLVIWLTKWLRQRGLKIGIVSRGYGGQGPFPLRVTADTPAAACGDEPAFLARRTGCPVAVDPDRVAAGELLIERDDVDVIVADDGLQHYALARDVEIGVVDGLRGVGNGKHLPVGPLREGVDRLAACDWVVANERVSGLVEKESVMSAIGVAFVNVFTEERQTPAAFRGRSITAVAGIGNPRRFSLTLARLGFRVPVRAFGDHHVFKSGDLDVPSGHTLVVTEKDAQKIKVLDTVTRDCWYLEIALRFDQDVDTELEALLVAKGILADGGSFGRVIDGQTVMPPIGSTANV